MFIELIGKAYIAKNIDLKYGVLSCMCLLTKCKVCHVKTKENVKMPSHPYLF